MKILKWGLNIVPGVVLGEHLAATCTDCNGTVVSVGTFSRVPPNWVVVSNLTNHGPLNSYSQDDFIRTMRTELTHDGRELSNESMPWGSIRGNDG